MKRYAAEQRLELQAGSERDAREFLRRLREEATRLGFEEVRGFMRGKSVTIVGTKRELEALLVAEKPARPSERN